MGVKWVDVNATFDTIIAGLKAGKKGRQLIVHRDGAA